MAKKNNIARNVQILAEKKTRTHHFIGHEVAAQQINSESPHLCLRKHFELYDFICFQQTTSKPY